MALPLLIERLAALQAFTSLTRALPAHGGRVDEHVIKRRNEGHSLHEMKGGRIHVASIHAKIMTNQELNSIARRPSGDQARHVAGAETVIRASTPDGIGNR